MLLNTARATALMADDGVDAIVSATLENNFYLCGLYLDAQYLFPRDSEFYVVAPAAAPEAGVIVSSIGEADSRWSRIRPSRTSSPSVFFPRHPRRDPARRGRRACAVDNRGARGRAPCHRGPGRGEPQDSASPRAPSQSTSADRTATFSCSSPNACPRPRSSPATHCSEESARSRPPMRSNA